MHDMLQLKVKHYARIGITTANNSVNWTINLVPSQVCRI